MSRVVFSARRIISWRTRSAGARSLGCVSSSEDELRRGPALAGCSRMPWKVSSLVRLAFLTAAIALSQNQREAARLDGLGECGESEGYYQKALATGSASPALLNNAGNHYLICGQPEKARSYFERVVKITPTHLNANLQLARLAVRDRNGD